MASLTALIDDILTRLHDDESTFSRAEIIRWLAEAYRKLCYQSRHAKTFTCLDMPPRHTRAVTFDWEKNVGSGSWRKWTFTNPLSKTECTFLWEVQSGAGVATDSSTTAVSNLWELAYAQGNVDTPYRFMLPKRDLGINHVWHNNELIYPVTTKILDSTETHWWYIGSKPYVWSMGLGDENSFEVYEIDTTYHQSFDYGVSDLGQPRAWFDDNDSFESESGTTQWQWAYSWDGEPEAATAGALPGLGRRFTFGPSSSGTFYTHDWEGDAYDGQSEGATTNWFESYKELPVGLLRTASSSSRQYWPSYQWSVVGAARQLGKSDDGIMVYHDSYPRDITSETEETPMIPDQMRKYLVYYALGILFGHQGEGYDKILAEHYKFRAARGLKILKKLGRIERVDEAYSRSGKHRGRREPPLPQLPSTFPRAPWLR